jgi:hypothetical protein
MMPLLDGQCGTSKLLACMHNYLQWRGILHDELMQIVPLALPELPDMQQPTAGCQSLWACSH